VGLPDEKSAKATVSGAVPDVGKPEKAAMGADPEAVYVNLSDADVVLVPADVLTVTSTVPVTPAGELTTICVPVFETKLALGTSAVPK
jgi:hypothetical protein